MNSIFNCINNVNISCEISCFDNCDVNFKKAVKSIRNKRVYDSIIVKELN